MQPSGLLQPLNVFYVVNKEAFNVCGTASVVPADLWYPHCGSNCHRISPRGIGSVLQGAMQRGLQASPGSV